MIWAEEEVATAELAMCSAAAVLCLRKALHIITAVGGFLGHNGNGELGVKSLWIGFQRVAACVEGMRIREKCGYGMLKGAFQQR